MTAFHTVSLSSSVELLLSIFFISCSADRGSQPKIVSSYQKEQWLLAGDTLRLICPVDSNPAPIVTWKKDGDDIHIGWERFRIREVALQIKAVESGDSGIYVCSATNGFGTVSAQFAICVSGNDSLVTTSTNGKDVTCNLNGNGELPSFVNMHKMKDRYVQLVEGDTTQLSCQAAGKPKPEIRWFKDGDELSSNYNSVGNNWLLTLSDVTVGDGGQYMCNVFNRVGSINYTYIVKITERQMSAQEFRLFVLKNVTVSVGSTASFHCEVHSDIETHIQWLRQIYPIVDKQNANYTIVVGDRHFTVVQRGSTQVLSDGRYLSKLTIRSVGMNDSGVYVCSAANSHGFRLQSAFLKVIPSTETFDSEFTGANSYSMSQFLPIVATIATMFFILVCGIVIYLVFQHCHPRARCSSSSSSSSSASHRHSPSSASAYVVPQTDFNSSCVPLKYHQHPQPQCASYRTKDCYKSPKVMECGCSVPLRTTQHMAPACQREHLLHAQQIPQEDLQLHFYEHC